MTKSEFIRSQGLDLSAKEVVEKGKEKGLKFSPAFVNTIRWQAKQPKKAANGKASGTKRVVGRPAKTAAKAKRANGNGHSSAEQQFASAAVELGLTRAEALLGGMRAKISSAIGLGSH